MPFYLEATKPGMDMSSINTTLNQSNMTTTHKTITITEKTMNKINEITNGDQKTKVRIERKTDILCLK